MCLIVSSVFFVKVALARDLVVFVLVKFSFLIV